eukprot:5840573-Amphidinium_carterae.1
MALGDHGSLLANSARASACPCTCGGVAAMFNTSSQPTCPLAAVPLRQLQLSSSARRTASPGQNKWIPRLERRFVLL